MTTARHEKPSVPTPDAAEVATANPDAGMWLIVSIKHGFHHDATVFWGPNQCGYTSYVEQAGRYTKEEADAICKRATHELWALPATRVVSESRRVLDASDMRDLKAEVSGEPGAQLIDLADVFARELLR